MFIVQFNTEAATVRSTQLLFGCNSETRKYPVWAQRQPQAFNGRSQALRLVSSVKWVNKCCLMLLWDRCARLFAGNTVSQILKHEIVCRDFICDLQECDDSEDDCH